MVTSYKIVNVVNIMPANVNMLMLALSSKHACARAVKSPWHGCILLGSEWKDGPHRERGAIFFKYGDNGADGLSWKAFIVFIVVVHMRGDRNCWVKNEKREVEREKFKPSFISFPHRVWNGGWMLDCQFWKVTKNVWAKPTRFWRQKSVGGAGFRKYDSKEACWQALILLKHYASAALTKVDVGLGLKCWLFLWRHH